ncbi:hypothetical protein GO755_20645 [Spirosoma sp. HMF4905]|uniref:PBCV-specific basic adaptor domain-containing protein n=1 Tax=Spirosoma arboris TaxID=2682092 RepID=A0A7K1SF74_9BACT|nr:hypothetical protein [Spirosoma arboris]MVM32465.1 hypothetical protein [Spirosoma arboris]
MKKIGMWLTILGGLLVCCNALGQTEPTSEKMPIHERMAKARAAKATKKGINGLSTSGATVHETQAKSNPPVGALTQQKAIPADYTAPIVKSLKGPNGEVVHTGEKGGKYYINKNGNKTYLSSNQ